jgi:hypothetical protein
MKKVINFVWNNLIHILAIVAGGYWVFACYTVVGDYDAGNVSLWEAFTGSLFGAYLVFYGVLNALNAWRTND